MQKVTVVFYLIIFVNLYSFYPVNLVLGQSSNNGQSDTNLDVIKNLQNIIGSSQYYEAVPTFDEEVYKLGLHVLRALLVTGASVDSLNVILSREFQLLNLWISQLLENQINDKITQIFVDTLKETTYVDYRVEVEKLIELSKITNIDTTLPGGSKSYREYIEEARYAGAILALQELREKLGPCLNPRIRQSISNYIIALTENYHLNITADNILKNVPNCEPKEFSNSTVFKPSFLVTLIQPFGLLAQIAQEPIETSELSPTVIMPKIQDTEDTVEESSVMFFINNLFADKIHQKEIERKQTLGSIKPLETCVKYDFLDDGTAICTQYNTIVDLLQLQKTLQSGILTNASLFSNTEATKIFPIFSNQQNVFVKLGLTTSTLTRFEDMGASLPHKDAIKSAIDQLCKSYFQGSENIDTFLNSYFTCLLKFRDNLSSLISDEYNKVKGMFDLAFFQQRNSYFSLLNDSDSILKKVQNGMPQSCTGAYEDIQNIYEDVKDKLNEYENLFRTIDAIKGEILAINMSMIDLNQSLDNLKNAINYTSFSVINILKHFVRPITDVQYLPLLPTLLSELKNVENKVGNTDSAEALEDLRNKIEEVLDREATIVEQFNRKYFDILYKHNISRTRILKDIYFYNEIIQRLNEYQRLLDSGGCIKYQNANRNLSSYNVQNNIISSDNITTPIVKFFNWKNLLNNFLGSKLVEIRFKR